MTVRIWTTSEDINNHIETWCGKGYKSGRCFPIEYIAIVINITIQFNSYVPD